MKSQLQLLVEEKLRNNEEVSPKLLYSLKMQLKHNRQDTLEKDLTETLLRRLNTINRGIEEKLTKLMPWWIEWYEQKIIDKHFNSL